MEIKKGEEEVLSLACYCGILFRVIEILLISKYQTWSFFCDFSFCFPLKPFFSFEVVRLPLPLPFAMTF